MHLPRSLQALLSATKKSVLLLGPRQTGKSTLVRALKPDMEINLSDEEVFIQFLKDPGLLRKRLLNHRRIFIDEIQRIPSLLNTVQALIDSNPKLQFFLTGSSARKLKRGKANLLPGRVLAYSLGPLCAEELEFNIPLEGPHSPLRKGLLPGIYLEEDEATWKKLLRSYSITYLKEEIQAEALTRNLEGFSRFFEVITSRAGDFVDFSKIASQAQIERMSASRYFDILIDTLVIHSVGPFTKSSKRRLTQHPRYYFFDIGVLNGSLNHFEITPERKGTLFEHLFLQLVQSGSAAKDVDLRISTYRTEAGAEVDFIIEKDREVFAIEVKHAKTVGTHDLRGLRSFSEFYGKKHTPMLVYPGEHPMNISGVEVLPLRHALQRLGL